MRTNTIASLIATAAAAHVVFAQTDTTFTYQGELNLLGTPVDGMCDFRFQLFEANIGGASLTKSLSKSNVTVANGRFSVDLDFGPGVFDGDQRWLNIDVRYPAGSGTFSTLSPRQQITRSPYSIQTRGIYVDGNERVGIGTTGPLAQLDVTTEAASSGNNTARFSAPNLGPRSSFIHWGTTGDWYIRSASTSGTVIMQNDGGSVGIGTASPRVPFDVALPANFQKRVGIGDPDVNLGQLTIADRGAPFALDAYSSGLNPTMFVRNSSTGPVLWAVGDGDTALSGGGLIVTGDEGGFNISIDANEIMARRAGFTATLHLNAEGGDINMGLHDIHPALAYGRVYEDGTLLSGSSNVTCERTDEGKYTISIQGGFQPTNDIPIVSMVHPLPGFVWGIVATNGTIEVGTYDDGGSADDRYFSFVVYRP